MGSVFAQLLDTLPMHQAVSKIEEAHGPILRASADDVRTYLRRLNTTSAYEQAVPRVPSTSRPRRERLWGWRHAGNPPNRFENLVCRVRDYGYHGFSVLENIELGWINGGQLRNEIRIRLSDGEYVALPLESRFVHSRFRARDGYTGENSHWLWPLQGWMDTGMVVAFAYELVRNGDTTTPMPYGVDRDPESAAALQLLESGDGAANWGERATQGDFMPLRTQRHAPSAEVGNTAEGAASAPKVLVTLSLALMRERADFDPGGVAGMCRIYPHAMVKASVPLRAVYGGLKMRRPSSSTVSAEGSGDDHVGCGGDSERTISPLMVTDANENAWAFDVGPFWSDIFAYVDDDWGRIGNSRMHVVKRSGARGRTIENYGRRHPTVGVTDHTTVTKKYRQGEFDSLHLAPSLRLNATASRPVAGRATGDPNPFPWTAIPSRDAFHLDHVKMAPFCSHDCLHTHWRWGEGLSLGVRSTMGWSASAPFAAAGAPMVPRNQDVWVTLPSKHELAYEAIAGAVQNGQIPAFSWQVFNHHGSAFVTAIAATEAYWAAKTAVGMLSGTEFQNGATRVSCQTSSAMFYWHLRYKVVHGTVEARVLLTPAQLAAARAL